MGEQDGVDRAELREQVAALWPGLDRRTLDEHFARLGADYFACHGPEEIARHVALSAEVSPSAPAQIAVRELGDGEHEIVVVAYDHFGELALLCGLLAGFGLDIRRGRIHTFERAVDPLPRRGRSARRMAAVGSTKLVDVFVVRPAGGSALDAVQQRELEAETRALLGLVSEGALVAARERLNRRLVERLASWRRGSAEERAPVEVRFGADGDAAWTSMEVSGGDAPGFLYALTNALALRGIYIHRVEIDSVDGRACDRFLISDRNRGPILVEGERAALRAAVQMIWQFTRCLPAAPDPLRAMQAFDQLADAIVERDPGGAPASLFGADDLDALAQVLGSSRFLWEDFLRVEGGALLPTLRRLKAEALPRGRERFARELQERLAPGLSAEEQRLELNRFKDRAMVLIDLKQILDTRVSLTEFSAALTELAEAVVARAFASCAERLGARHGRPLCEDGTVCAFAVLGLGKFGGGELGYASDIELLVVYGGGGWSEGPERIENAAWFDALVHDVVETIEARRHGIFELDLRLRPHGRKGALACAVEELERYYRADGEAAPFERQALIKLRPVSGDAELGRRVEAARDRFVYGGAPWDGETSLRLRGRQLAELVQPGEVNVKLGAGGVTDVEYAVQYLQIQHGAQYPDLRTPRTLEALARLAVHAVVSPDDHARLESAYLFLRRVIDALRMVRGNAKDLVLPGEGTDELAFLARRLGIAGESWAASARSLREQIRVHMDAAHEFYVRRFGDPATP